MDIVSPVPVLAWNDGKPELVNTYSRKTRILATGGAVDPISLEESITSLCNLLRDFDFVGDGDLGRAISFIITPALTQGGFLGADRAPLFLVEKDNPGAGSGYFIKIVSAIYGLNPRPITRIDSPDRFSEDISRALLFGDSLIYIDNARGKGLQKLPVLESLLTEPIFLCRVPYKQGEADVTRRVLAVSSNGAVFSPDLANRTVKIGIRRRPQGYHFYDWPEVGILEHINANRSRYLSAVFCLVQSWAKEGSPSGQNISGFRYTQWERAAVWILEKHFSGLPLIEAEHREAQMRLADPDHDLLRNLFRLVVDGEIKARQTATSLAEIGVNAGILENPVDQAKLTVGKALKRRFPKDGNFSYDSGRFNVYRESYKNLSSSHDVKYYSISIGEGDKA